MMTKCHGSKQQRNNNVRRHQLGCKESKMRLRRGSWQPSAHPPSPSPRTNPCLGRQRANSRRSLPTRPHRVPRKGQGTSMTFSSEDAVLSNLRSVLGLSVGKIRLDDLDESKQVRHNKSSARFRHIKELANP